MWLCFGETPSYSHPSRRLGAGDQNLGGPPWLAKARPHWRGGLVRWAAHTWAHTARWSLGGANLEPVASLGQNWAWLLGRPSALRNFSCATEEFFSTKRLWVAGTQGCTQACGHTAVEWLGLMPSALCSQATCQVADGAKRAWITCRIPQRVCLSSAAMELLCFSMLPLLAEAGLVCEKKQKSYSSSHDFSKVLSPLLDDSAWSSELIQVSPKWNSASAVSKRLSPCRVAKTRRYSSSARSAAQARLLSQVRKPHNDVIITEGTEQPAAHKRVANLFLLRDWLQAINSIHLCKNASNTNQKNNSAINSSTGGKYSATGKKHVKVSRNNPPVMPS